MEMMKPRGSELSNQMDILFEGMAPNPKIEFMIRTKLAKVVDMCPDNSFIQARVKDLGSRFAVEILVRHVMGQFLAYCEERTLGESVNLSASQMYDQIKAWRETRNLSGIEPGAPFKVLIVDDDPISVKLIESCLTQRGCETHVVENGQDAVDEIFEHAYDLIILDWNMPSMNGLQTIKMLDETADLSATGVQNKKVPVLIYSASPRSQIVFPKSKTFRKIGYLQKTSTYDSIRKTTDLFLDSLKKIKEKTMLN
ncbi:response regulator [Bdellovibrio sp. HCB337]|uniref:response regulator n=1 Tax=Bdellovibrio sp. HCB337 TaxID=3394358 RepID=UPI0039A5C1B2